MFSNLKVTILGDYVKITSVKLKTSSNIMAKIKSSSENKLQNNVIRAKNKINDIALANDFQYFFTLTFKPCYDREDVYTCLTLFRSHLRIMREKIGLPIRYLIVPEQHKDGAWHFHGFFDDNIKYYLYVNDYGYLSVKNMDSLGFMNIDVIKDKLRVSSYVTKYVTKNLGSGIKKYRNSYFCSTGLSHGVEDLNKLYDNEYFNQKFFEFSNDYCYRKIITLQEYYKLKDIIDRL